MCCDPTARDWGKVVAFLDHCSSLCQGHEFAVPAIIKYAQASLEKFVAATLHDAAATGDCATLGRLLAAGYEIEARDFDGSTALHAAVQGGSLAATRLLLEQRADPTATNNYSDTPLHVAAGGGALAVVKLLVGNGAAPLAQNRFGATALDVALREDASQMARPEEHEAVVAYLKEEAKPLAALPPAERAIRKVRAAKLAERQQQEALQRMPNLL